MAQEETNSRISIEAPSKNSSEIEKKHPVSSFTSINLPVFISTDNSQYVLEEMISPPTAILYTEKQVEELNNRLDLPSAVPADHFSRAD